MFTAILTATYSDGVTTVFGDGYAASGADELHDFVTELITRARTAGQGSGRSMIGFTLSVAIS